MSDDLSLAGHLIVGLEGPGLTPREMAWLERWRPAGIILFARNVTGPDQTRALCSRLHDLVPGLEIVADHEGGPVSPLAAAVGRPPAAWGMGLLDDPDLTRRVHTATAERLAALGVDRVLAPVADVLTEAHNPVIGVRAFGADSDLVSRHVAAAVAGLRTGGCRVCLKHWPGHGGSVTDSHRDSSVLTSVPSDVPFRAGLDAGADAVMLGHLQQTGALVATLDPAQAAAARQLGGTCPPLLLADDVTMGALRPALAARGVTVPPGSGLVDPGELAADWFTTLVAGDCDRLLVRGIPWRAFPADGGSGTAVMATDQPPPRPAAAWEDVWRGLAVRIPEAFMALHGKPGWLDRTVGDRWGPVDDPGPGLLPSWSDRFPSAADPLPFDTDLLLVTSHRPLDTAAEVAAGWLAVLAPRGVALGVGHPSLARDLAALLPVDWEVHGTPE